MPYITYKPKIAAEILGRIANGEALMHICGPKRHKRLPQRATVYFWLGRYENFRKAYVMARRAQADLYADEIIDIADGRDAGAVEPRDIQRDKLRVQTRQWLMAVLAPNLYSERMMMSAAGGDDPPVREEDDTAMAARIAAIFESAKRRRDRDAG